MSTGCRRRVRQSLPTGLAAKYGLWIIASPLFKNLNRSLSAARALVGEFPVGAVQARRETTPRLAKPQYLVDRDRGAFPAKTALPVTKRSRIVSFVRGTDK